MAELDHWHPLLFAGELGEKPVAVRLLGRELVLFRAQDGKIGALADACPHRGMRLSEGRVLGGRLVCPYHGWSWAPDGTGKSPGTPTAKPCAEHFDAVERLGTIWVKRAGVATPFPSLDVSGWHLIGRSRHRAKAPLEPVLDNFIEVEHTPMVHVLLGYPVERMHEVECEVLATDATVRVYNVGPQRSMPRPLYPLFQIEPGDLFVDDWTTHFSPVYTVYDQYWLEPRTRTPRPNRLRIAVFFVPVSEGETDIVALSYSLAPPWERRGLNVLLFGLTRAFVGLEIGRDADLLGKLADKSPTLKGKSLGRFDKALVLARRRLDRVYRGHAPGALPVVAARDDDDPAELVRRAQAALGEP
jgi:vanillate O-demethylase monooxygenase subunit